MRVYVKHFGMDRPLDQSNAVAVKKAVEAFDSGKAELKIYDVAFSVGVERLREIANGTSTEKASEIMADRQDRETARLSKQGGISIKAKRVKDEDAFPVVSTKGKTSSDDVPVDEWGNPIEWIDEPTGEKVIDVVVTRHPALVRYLSALGMTGPETKIISHATPDEIKGKRVAGVLPHSLSCLCKSFTEVPLVVPAEMRGKELNFDDIKRFAGDVVTYKVSIIKP